MFGFTYQSLILYKVFNKSYKIYHIELRRVDKSRTTVNFKYINLLYLLYTTTSS